VRVFFDANVLVRAFLARELCADLLHLVFTEHTLVTSAVVLASAVLANADLVVTGDQGALACRVAPMPLVNPRGCWEQLRAAG